MADVKDAIQEIIDELKNLDGIRRIPDAPPENNNQFPFVVVYPISGSFTKPSSGWLIGLHDINIELHIKRKDLPRDFDEAMDLFQDLPKQLMSGQENGRFSNGFTWQAITYLFGPLEWAGVETIGFTFTLNGAKVQDTVS